jgi:plastocyanin
MVKNHLPRLIPIGPGDAFQGGAQPCYQASGLPPEKTACQVHSGEFTGTETDVSSGYLDANTPWSLKISDTAKPGQYHFFCQLHGPGMGGVLTVAPKDTAIASPTDVRAAGDAQLKADTSKIAPAAAQLSHGTASNAFAGMFSTALPYPAAVAGFGPSNVRVPVGGTVKWTIQGPHVIFFNAPADAQQFRVAAPDGSVHVNPKAAAPVGGPGAPQRAGPFDGGSWNGVGPHSSGAMISFPPKLYTYSLRFTKAGTYSFICTFHVNMKGTVTVG